MKNQKFVKYIWSALQKKKKKKAISLYFFILLESRITAKPICLPPLPHLSRAPLHTQNMPVKHEA